MNTLKDFFEAIWSLSADQVAIISLIITLLLFVIGKISENRLKIYETRKTEYQKLLDVFQQIFNHVGEKTEDLHTNPKYKQQILEAGASLAIYGSKRLYKEYCFYRRLANDEKVQKSKWYDKEMSVYSLAEMYRILRKEIGLNYDLIPLDTPDVLAFVLTDFTKPEFKKKFYKFHFNKFILNSAIFWGKIEDFIPLVWISNYIIKPFFFTLFCIVRFPFKLCIITPYRQWKERRIKKHTNKHKKS